MLISTEAGTAEILSSRDGTRFYDDVGCLAADWRSHAAGASAFVRLAAGGWQPVESAWFGRPAAVLTPMGSGLAAFATATEAAAADPQGGPLTWKDVVALAAGSQR